MEGVTVGVTVPVSVPVGVSMTVPVPVGVPVPVEVTVTVMVPVGVTVSVLVPVTVRVPVSVGVPVVVPVVVPVPAPMEISLGKLHFMSNYDNQYQHILPGKIQTAEDMLNLPTSIAEELRIDIVVQDLIEMYPGKYAKKDIMLLREYVRRKVLPKLMK